MKPRIALLLALGAAAFQAAGSAGVQPPDELRLDGTVAFSLPPSTPATREALLRDWGQFELRIPKERFPWPAPHCRATVILRFPAIAPNQADRESRLDRRWLLLQQLRASKPGDADAPTVRLDTRHYVTPMPGGRHALRYCNAFVAD